MTDLTPKPEYEDRLLMGSKILHYTVLISVSTFFGWMVSDLWWPLAFTFIFIFVIAYGCLFPKIRKPFPEPPK